MRLSYGGLDPETPVIAALRKVASNEGPATKILLARLEEHSATISRQKQIITALQFRHVLEHLPKPSRKNEADRWKDFWDSAVAIAYREYKDDQVCQEVFQLAKNSTASGGKPEDWLNDRYKDGGKTTSLTSDDAKKLEEAFKLAVGKDQQDPMRWLINAFKNGTRISSPLLRAQGKLNETLRDAFAMADNKSPSNPSNWLKTSKISSHAHRLYSTLSEMIHSYLDGRFEVNSSNFDTSDYQLLAAIIPDMSNVEIETVKWDEERHRYGVPI
ncbi:hypothetical protein SLS63_013666 [Diaporthe eres]|uniref:Uncharacterized protein n=1 Tax=Diaporthe eres TaxID=83184 RepID=A0ABR1NMT7_DIAER